MARPERKNADYFPFYAKDGRTLFILEGKYRCKGSGFFTNVMRFLTLQDDHYFCISDETNQMYFLSKCHCDEVAGIDMLEIMTKTGKLDRDLWENHKIIACQDLLDSLEHAYRKRSNKIITMDEIRVYSTLNPVNSGGNPVNSANKPQRKEKKRKEKKKKQYSPNSEEFRLSIFLLEEIQKRKPDFKKPNLQKWAIHIDRMIRLDDRTPERIKEIIEWCQQDDFWQNNILSTEKLRIQFDKLELQMEKDPDYEESRLSPAMIKLLAEEAREEEKTKT